MSQENVKTASAEELNVKKALLIKEDDTIIKSSNEDLDFDDGGFDDNRSIKTVKSSKSFRNLINREASSGNTFDSIFDKLSGSISDSDIESDTDSVGSYVAQKSLVPKPDFFDTLDDIPSLSAISYESSEQKEIVTETPKVSLVNEESKGYFVDPLTGERLPSEEDIPQTEVEAEPELREMEDEEGEEEEQDDEDEDLLLPLDIEEDEIVMEQVHDIQLDLWFHEEEPKVVRIVENIDFELFERLEHERELKELTTQFLDHLIDNVVKQCTYVDPKPILRQSLDKQKLMAELQYKLTELEIEQKIRYMLNRKAVEHFRRKKSFRAILDDNPDNITQVIDDYKQATTALDQALGREKEMREFTREQIKTLQTEVFEEEVQSVQDINSMQDIIKNALHVERFNQLTKIVENEFTKMAKLRREISDVRYELIQKQHTMAMLDEKMKKLDNLGDGLSLRTHEQIQTEVNKLGKKNEDRNCDLNKIRTRYNASVHILSHIKDHKLGLLSMVNIQEQALLELLDEKKEIREKISNLKVDQRKLRNEILNLSYQGGLIDKPALMRDYDETVELLLEKRPQVEKMRQKHNDLEHKIAVLEAKCRVVKVQ